MYVNITSRRAWLAPLSNYFVEIFRSVNWNDPPGLLLRPSILNGNGAIQSFLLRHPNTFTKPNPDSLISISPNMQYASAVVGRQFCQKLTLWLFAKSLEADLMRLGLVKSCQKQHLRLAEACCHEHYRFQLAPAVGRSEGLNCTK